MNTLNHGFSRTLIAAITLIPCVATSVLGQVIHEDSKLVTDDMGESNRIGRSVAIDNGIIAFGVRAHWSNKIDTSAAYLFDVTTGSQLLRLIPNDSIVDSWFGSSIVIEDNIVAVGAPNDQGSGSVFLFDATTGEQVARFTPDKELFGETFGWSIAIDHGIMAVGASGSELDGRRLAGAAYLFDLATGTQIAKLQPDEGIHHLFFGISVAIDDGLVVVGASGGFDAGSAYIFDATTGERITKLLPTGEPSFGQFGNAVDIQDGVIAIGAPTISRVGTTYLFDAETGDLLHELRPETAELSDHFGTSVSIDDGLVAIGAMNYSDTVSSGLDFAYVYDISSGELLSTLAPSDHGLEDIFSNSIAMENGVVIASATDVNDAEERNASIYIFELNGLPCTADFTGDGEINFFDLSVFLYALGRREQIADLTNDGNWNYYDVSAFLLAYSAGCP